jgi:hypothetical protein
MFSLLLVIIVADFAINCSIKSKTTPRVPIQAEIIVDDLIDGLSLLVVLTLVYLHSSCIAWMNTECLWLSGNLWFCFLLSEIADTRS